MDKERRPVGDTEQKLILGPVFASEIIIEILGFYGPMMADGVFDTGARSPTDVGLRKANRIGNSVMTAATEVGIRRIIDVAVSNAARGVKQHPAPGSKSDPSPGRSEPLNAFMCINLSPREACYSSYVENWTLGVLPFTVG